MSAPRRNRSACEGRFAPGAPGEPGAPSERTMPARRAARRCAAMLAACGLFAIALAAAAGSALPAVAAAADNAVAGAVSASAAVQAEEEALSSELASGSTGGLSADENGALPIYTAEQFVRSLEEGGSYYLAADIVLGDQADSDGKPKECIAMVEHDVYLDMHERTVTISAEYPSIMVTNGGKLTVVDALGRPSSSSGFVIEKASYYSVFWALDGGTIAFSHNIEARADVKVPLFSAGFASSITLSGGGSMHDCVGSSSPISAHATGDGEKAEITVDDFTISKVSSKSAGIARVQGSSAAVTFTSKALVRSCDYWSEGLLVAEEGGSILFSGLIANCGEAGDSTTVSNGPVVLVKSGGHFTMDCADDERHGIVNNNCKDVAAAIRVGEMGVAGNAGAAAVLQSGRIAGNRCTETLGQLYVCNGATFEVRGGTVEGWNRSTQGSCVNVASGGTLAIYDGVLKGASGTAVEKGGLVFSEGCLNMYGGTLDGSGVSANDGGLIYMATTPVATYTAVCTLQGGTLANGCACGNASVGQKGRGGAVFVSSGFSTLILGSDTSDGRSASGVVIRDCRANDMGGAVFAKDATSVVMGYGAIIRDCTAAYVGYVGAGGSDGAAARAEAAQGEGAAAPAVPAAARNDALQSYGGAVYLSDDATSMRMSGDALISGCSTEGPDSQEGDRGFGGGIYSHSRNLNIEHSAAIEQCSAQDAGGAVCMEAAENAAQLAADDGADLNTQQAKIDGSLKNNSAKLGGGVYAKNFTARVFGDVCENNATDGGGVYADGGSITLAGSFSDNEARRCGGAVFAGNASVDLNGTVSGNKAGVYAGGIYVSNGAHSQVRFNSAFDGFLVVCDNECTGNPRYSNLFLDYLGQAGAYAQGEQRIACSIANKLKNKDIVCVGITPEACDWNGVHWRDIVSGNGAQAVFFRLDDGSDDLALINDEGSDAIRVLKRIYTVFDRASLEKAIREGGEHPLVSDVDLSGEADLKGYTVENTLSLTMNGFFIIADTSKMGAPLFTVQNGGKLTIGTQKEEGTPGGLLGCATPESHKGFHSAVLVGTGGEFRLHKTIAGFATSFYREGAAVAVVSKAGTIYPNATFYLEGGAIRDCYSEGRSGAIFALNNAVIVMNGGEVEGAAGAFDGSCVDFFSGTLTATGTVFRGKDCGRGGCLYLPLGTKAELTNCRLHGARANEGGCIFAEEAQLTLRSTELDGGYAYGNAAGTAAGTAGAAGVEGAADGNGCGGGIYAMRARLSLDSASSISGCTAENAGGGIWWFGGRTGGSLDCAAAIDGNRAGGNGGGLYADGSDGADASLTGIVSKNEAGAYGGGVFLGVPVHLTVGSSVVLNRAGEDGGGIFAAASKDTALIDGDLETRVTRNTGKDGAVSNVAYGASMVDPELGDDEPGGSGSAGDGTPDAGGDAGAGAAAWLAATGDSVPAFALGAALLAVACALCLAMRAALLRRR